jgi:uncharacterized protein (DUF952 family)
MSMKTTTGGARGAAIFKILRADEWRDFELKGVFKGAPVDVADGYIHLSAAAQVAETARKHFAGVDGLTLVAVDPAAAGAALRWEPSRGGALFPHLYGELRMAHVLWTAPLPLGPDGVHGFPPETFS